MKKETIKTESGTITVITAEEGKVFQKIETEEIYGSTIYLGKLDSEENYREIDFTIDEDQK